MKSKFFLIVTTCVVLSMTLFSFTSSDSSNGEVVLLSNGNYIMEGVNFSEEDEHIFRMLQEEVGVEAQGNGFFFVSCYEKNEHRFKHGRILGSGCCTSGSAEAEEQNPEVVQMARGKIDGIMAKYMVEQ